MKKFRFLAMALIAIAVTTAKAQGEIGSITIKPMVGVTISNVSNYNQYSEALVSTKIN